MTYCAPIGSVPCATCENFDADKNNPVAAMGRCLAPARHGYFFAQAMHVCGDHAEIKDDAHD